MNVIWKLRYKANNFGRGEDVQEDIININYYHVRYAAV